VAEPLGQRWSTHRFRIRVDGVLARPRPAPDRAKNPNAACNRAERRGTIAVL
jgi:hypothetical protein